MPNLPNFCFDPAEGYKLYKSNANEASIDLVLL